MNTDPRVDAYLEAADPFAQPILRKLRALVRKTCPAATETIKWRVPAYEYKGLLCAVAATKNYAILAFFKAKLMKAPERKITSLDEMPSDRELIAALREAMALNEQGAKVPKKKHAPLPVPADLQKALKGAPAKAFAKMPPSHQREYIWWINEAKREETRKRRIAQAVEMIGEGKSRNWKYE
jgi:uncharacterized protein YdeI (YjbR/CyaY-like superfamily)